MSQPKITLIAGPTASGKSALALDLARKNNGVIINADAMQIYAGLPILTAQPSAEDQQRVPHELYGILDPHEASSAGKWLTLALEAIQRTLDAGRHPILVGGTGLYFHALLGGLADIPPIPDDVRAEAQRLYDEVGEEKFRRTLAKRDPESVARFAKNDRQRLIRAYEVLQHTGKPIGYWHRQKDLKKNNGFKPEFHLLMPPREELYAACDRRMLVMVERGAFDEVWQFSKLGIPSTAPASKIIGVQEFKAFFEGKVSREEAIAAAQQATRNYAKRQMTWFRNQWKFTKKS